MDKPNSPIHADSLKTETLESYKAHRFANVNPRQFEHDFIGVRPVSVSLS